MPLWCVVTRLSSFLSEDIGSALKGGAKVCQRQLVNEVLGPLVTQFALNLVREDATPVQRGFHGGLLESRLGRRTHQTQRASTSRSRAYKKSPGFTQERPVWFPKNASRCPKESRTKSSLSLVTLNRGPMGSGCCKSAAPKCVRSGYEKMRPVSQKARVRCPLP